MKIRLSYAFILLVAAAMVVVIIISTVDVKDWGWFPSLFLVGVLVMGVVATILPEYRAAGTAGGLARMDASKGTFIMYSAGVGETALDRLPNDPDKVNSIYTRTLLPLLRRPGLTLPELAGQVRSEVSAIVASVPHVQRPAYYDRDVTYQSITASKSCEQR